MNRSFVKVQYNITCCQCCGLYTAKNTMTASGTAAAGCDAAD